MDNNLNNYEKINDIDKKIEVTYLKHNKITNEKEVSKIILDKEITVYDLFSKNVEKFDEIMAVRVNNSVKSLKHKITKNCEIELIDIHSEDGRNIYIKTLLFILCMAIDRKYKGALLTVDYQLHNAMYIRFDNLNVTTDVINVLKEEMNNIINSNLDILMKKMSKEDAISFYEKIGVHRGYMQVEEEQKEEVTLYFCEEYFNYFYGVMPLTTGAVKLFDLEIKDEGLILKYPDRTNYSFVPEFENKMKLKKTLEEYKDIYNVIGIKTLHHLNKMIKNDPKELILLSEALHEKKIFDLSKQILSKDGIKMILIAGPSSSGKTTFAGKLSNALKIRGIKPVTISVDNYFVEREDTPKDEFGKMNFESIHAIDLELFNDHLEKLINGEEIIMPVFNFKTGKKEYGTKTTKLHEDEILVIEGIHCLNDELTSKIPNDKKFKVYISALTVLNIDYFNRISTTDTRLIRRIVRDFKTRGYSAKTTIGMWESVRRGERENIFPYQESADFMFNSSVIYELAVLKNEIEPLLQEIDNSNYEHSEARRLLTLLKYVKPIDKDLVPNNSLIREFLGGSIFE